MELTKRERIDRATDAIGDLIGIAPESLAITGEHVCLTPGQAERVVAVLEWARENGCELWSREL